MKKLDLKLVAFRIPEDDYEKLVSLQTNDLRSVSAVIRNLISRAINSPAEVKPIELKPLVNLANPVELETIKTPLEIPVQDDSIIESAPLIHRTGRKVSPNTLAIKMAKRAKDMGRPYDISMEQHFHILDELE